MALVGYAHVNSVGQSLAVQLGKLQPAYFLEVTSAVSAVDHLKREANESNGGDFHGEAIHVEGKRSEGTRRVVSEPVAEDSTSSGRVTERGDPTTQETTDRGRFKSST